MTYIAHYNEHKIQTVHEHNKNVATLCSHYMSNFMGGDYVDIAHFIGMYHDWGKYNPYFQAKIHDAYHIPYDYNVSNDNIKLTYHAPVSSMYVSKLVNNKQVLMISQAMIGWHHTGLHNMSNTTTDGTAYKISYDAINMDAIPKYDVPVPSSIELHDGTKNDTIIRMLYSSLIDADRTDTATFAGHPPKERKIDWHDAYKSLIRYIRSLRKPGKSEQQTLRDMVLSDSIKSAKNGTGFYVLNAPTGSGKTLASLAFAIQHVMHNNLDRIILVLPFISLIEQTAKIFKDILGEDNVLMHYSTYVNDDQNKMWANKKGAERWDYPVIITTNVQFFESLHGCSPRKVRKLHRMANSVIMFDEVQTFPRHIYSPIIQSLWDLVDVADSSVVLATATMPPITNTTSIISNKVKSVKQHKKFVWDESVLGKKLDEYGTIKFIKDKINDDGLMAVFNSKQQVANIYNSIAESTDNHVIHLSTNMCPKHRLDAMDRINNKSIVIATSLVEAGMDYSFGVVIRDMAGLSSINQIAGRCNRENDPNKIGMVYIIKTGGYFIPDEVDKQASITYSMIKTGNVNPLGHNDLIKYFSMYYDNTDPDDIIKLREKLQFGDVCEKFHVIEKKDEISVVVPYGDYEKILNEIMNGGNILTGMRKLSPYMVSLSEEKLSKLKYETLTVNETDIIVIDKDSYDMNTGVIITV